MRIVVACLVLALIALQCKLWIGDGSIPQWTNVERRLAAQELENKKLIARNHAMEADILELKSGEQALEEQARYELGMVKNGEVYYHFTE